MAGDTSFLGRGWSFPPEFTKPLGLPQALGAVMVEGVADIEQSIGLILSTSPGERIMEPKFGCPLADFMFRNIDVSVKALIEDKVRAALLCFEPRISVDAATVDASAAAEGRLEIGIEYRVRTTNSRHNMVYPFSLGEGTLLQLP
ncbi:GPW/gp25 family protein [Prosthecobacter sp.]|jgi:phage baseplate assembly protein W|uniref:GPW/gp25 family protein n=1 Tax=Prosthecobacter sp. TaxID=1965333 RepID=UPI0037C8FD90